MKNLALALIAVFAVSNLAFAHSEEGAEGGMEKPQHHHHSAKKAKKEKMEKKDMNEGAQEGAGMEKDKAPSAE